MVRLKSTSSDWVWAGRSESENRARMTFSHSLDADDGHQLALAASYSICFREFFGFLYHFDRSRTLSGVVAIKRKANSLCIGVLLLLFTNLLHMLRPQRPLP